MMGSAPDIPHPRISCVSSASSFSFPHIKVFAAILTMQAYAQSSVTASIPKTRKRVASTTRASTAYPRKRAVTACQVCRARRTKYSFPDLLV